MNGLMSVYSPVGVAARLGQPLGSGHRKEHGVEIGQPADRETDRFQLPPQLAGRVAVARVHDHIVAVNGLLPTPEG